MASSPLGRPTRGTTGTNRLRRNDRWIASSPAFRRSADPLVIDLGYGASGVTALELAARLRRTRADAEARGLDIDPARVATADRQLAEVRAGRTSFASDLRVSFAGGGFEAPLPAGLRPAVIRAMNVLRQYDEDDVPAAWRTMTARLAPAGLSSRAPAMRSVAWPAGSMYSPTRRRCDSRSRCGWSGSSSRASWRSGCRRR